MSFGYECLFLSMDRNKLYILGPLSYLASRITTSTMFDWPSFNSRAHDWTDMPQFFVFYRKFWNFAPKVIRCLTGNWKISLEKIYDFFGKKFFLMIKWKRIEINNVMTDTSTDIYCFQKLLCLSNTSFQSGEYRRTYSRAIAWVIASKTESLKPTFPNQTHFLFKTVLNQSRRTLVI